ncbi:hypothetical protein L541_0829 [Bordetella hinzii CA90 BAL1384]|uniref:Uncharacterized protein n=1 Tax=Bordetella hinzii OH87 BAL007II TaxID=1331262 RepID=A0ABR4R5Q2_9BORD|nr:hypothetical protein L544_3489 [Bordetella hinzii OH87 BAL007II]KCB26761.1 hypothetical protein L543_3334 [Bordetella hinzii L60]KCB29656.1 hypothetical protein L541_0829 [Bordetella hinzii CA90 BAL1384]KCB40780.1 hypothetical protein L539_0768 [Bordetella hinzii 5132]KCB49333.1 hypothetical protein L538_3522 [Bordetella hinzii 4161]KCB51888.1 hypothetical protein L537_0756 [Bordetella hinzii 1277]
MATLRQPGPPAFEASHIGLAEGTRQRFQGKGSVNGLIRAQPRRITLS